MPAPPMMKIALKHGIAVTLVIAAWVALKHFVLHLEGHRAQVADLAVFNLAAITGLAMGMKAKRAVNGGGLSYGQGLMTGISIAVAYSLLTSLYFLLLLVLVGPKLMQQEGETNYVLAFFGSSVVFAVFGAILSAIIALFLKTEPRASGETPHCGRGPNRSS